MLNNTQQDKLWELLKEKEAAKDRLIEAQIKLRKLKQNTNPDEAQNL